MESAPHDADLRIGEYNGDGRAAQAKVHLLAQRETCGILASNAVTEKIAPGSSIGAGSSASSLAASG